MAETKKSTIEFTEGEITDVVVYKLKKYHDDRGWLAELFRHDELAEEFYPVMSYISFTKPGIARGPHEHVDQADLDAVRRLGNGPVAARRFGPGGQSGRAAHDRGQPGDGR